MSRGDVSDGFSSGLAAGAPVIYPRCLRGDMVGSNPVKRNGVTACTCCGVGASPIRLPTAGTGGGVGPARDPPTPNTFTSPPPPDLLLPAAQVLPKPRCPGRGCERGRRSGAGSRGGRRLISAPLSLRSWQQNVNQINGLIAPLLVTKLILLSALNKC